jgi:hypothetical protein
MGMKDDIVKRSSGCPRLISSAEIISLPAIDGKATIAQATDVFNRIDSNFSRWGTDVPDQPSDITDVQVYEVIGGNTLDQIFGVLSGNLDELYPTQSQIICFVKNHSKWLSTGKRKVATFFLFKADDKFFAARVIPDMVSLLIVDAVRSCGMWTSVNWRRVVVPLFHKAK